MCIAILNRAGTLSAEKLRRASIANPDGAGMMYSNGKKLVVMKSLKNQDIITSYLNFRKKDQNTPVVLHFRIATDGGVNLANCHPYWVNDSVAMVHNGVLTDYSGFGTKKSDTRLFIDDILSDIPTDILFTETIGKLLGKAIGYNKFIFMRDDGLYMIVNDVKGHWDKKKNNWFSNDSYKPAKYTTNQVYSWYYDESDNLVCANPQGKTISKISNSNVVYKKPKRKMESEPKYCQSCGCYLVNNYEKENGHCKWCWEWKVINVD